MITFSFFILFCNVAQKIALIAWSDTKVSLGMYLNPIIDAPQAALA